MATAIKEHMQPIWKPFLGVGAPAAGVIASCLPQIEQWLRIASLVAGITVSVCVIITYVIAWWKAYKNRL